MGDRTPSWHHGETLAYTEHDGPGRPRAGPSRWSMSVITGVLAMTFVGVLASDTLCPDHRAWVQALAVMATAAAATALVALWRGWAVASLLTVLAGVAGMAIGLLDAAHAPTRGLVVVGGFFLVTLLAGAVEWRGRVVNRTARSIDPRSGVRPTGGSAGEVIQATEPDRESEPLAPR